VNAGIAVSRVGARRVKAMRQVAGTLRLDLTVPQLAAFAPVRHDLDAATQSSVAAAAAASEC
jgi:F0F1-type ATP synthase alpha subunit